jgi:cytochrome c oxidase cbb3-type subunit I/II
MPNYAWLLSQKLDTSVVIDRMRALRKVGVPYTDLTFS